MAAAEIVNHYDVMPSIGKVKASGPSAKSVASEDDDLLRLSGSIGADVINVASVLEGLHDQGGALCGR